MSSKYRSKFEFTVAEILQRNKIPFKYETVKIPYKYPVSCDPCSKCGHTEHFVSRYYIPDFTFRQDKIILEPKGKMDAKERKKFLAILASNPGLDLRLMFMRNNRIRPRSKTYYSDWAEKHGIKYCIGKIPPKWMKEFKSGDK